MPLSAGTARGFPNRGRGEEIPLAARIVHVADDVAAYHPTVGSDGVLAMVRERTGRGYDPAVVHALSLSAQECLACLDMSSAWEAVLDGPPDRETQPILSGAALDRALEVVADF